MHQFRYIRMAVAFTFDSSSKDRTASGSSWRTCSAVNKHISWNSPMPALLLRRFHELVIVLILVNFETMKFQEKRSCTSSARRIDIRMCMFLMRMIQETAEQ
jgi:hypothetical protein